MSRLGSKLGAIRADQILLILAIALSFFFYPGESRYAYSQGMVGESVIARNPLPDFTPAPYPARLGWYNAPIVSAQAVFVFDPESGVTLYEKNATSKLSPASTTKLMTAVVALEQFNLDEVLTVKNLVADGKDMGLFFGERMSVENLLYGALVHSANDAAYVLAENYPGGVTAFINAMNKKAIELGLKDTNFANSIGYDAPNQYITAKDLAILSNYALQNPEIAHMVGTKSITVADASYSYFHYLQNVNELLGEVAGVAGVKTGFTESAGENLATMVKRDNHNIMFVILNSEDRFADTRALINWVFQEYRWAPILSTRD